MFSSFSALLYLLIHKVGDYNQFQWGKPYKVHRNQDHIEASHIVGQQVNYLAY